MNKNRFELIKLIKISKPTLKRLNKMPLQDTTFKNVIVDL